MDGRGESEVHRGKLKRLAILPRTPARLRSAVEHGRSRMNPSSISEEALLEAVADTSRRRVLDLILAHGEVTPTALAAELPITRLAVSKALTALHRLGLGARSRP